MKVDVRAHYKLEWSGDRHLSVIVCDIHWNSFLSRANRLTIVNTGSGNFYRPCGTLRDQFTRPICGRCLLNIWYFHAGKALVKDTLRVSHNNQLSCILIAFLLIRNPSPLLARTLFYESNRPPWTNVRKPNIKQSHEPQEAPFKYLLT